MSEARMNVFEDREIDRVVEYGILCGWNSIKIANHVKEIAASRHPRADDIKDVIDFTDFHGETRRLGCRRGPDGRASHVAGRRGKGRQQR